jgi:hypothetical protein
MVLLMFLIFEFCLHIVALAIAFPRLGDLWFWRIERKIEETAAQPTADKK